LEIIKKRLNRNYPDIPFRQDYQDKQYNKMIQDLIFGYALSSEY